MFSHMMVGSNDIARSKTFYDALFGAIGGKPAIEDDKGRLLYLHKGGIFMVTPPIDGAPATHANGGTIGFAMDDPAQADAWHKAGRREWRHRDRGSAGRAHGAASATCTSPICAIPTATNCARCTACRLHEVGRVTEHAYTGPKPKANQGLLHVSPHPGQLK